MSRATVIEIDSEEMRVLLKRTKMSRVHIANKLHVSLASVAMWVKRGKIRPIHLDVIMGLIDNVEGSKNDANSAKVLNFCPCCGHNFTNVKAA